MHWPALDRPWHGGPTRKRRHSTPQSVSSDSSADDAGADDAHSPTKRLALHSPAPAAYGAHGAHAGIVPSRGAHAPLPRAPCSSPCTSPRAGATPDALSRLSVAEHEPRRPLLRYTMGFRDDCELCRQRGASRQLT